MSSKVVRFYPFFAFWVFLRTVPRISEVGRGKILARVRNWKIKFLTLSEASKLRFFFLVAGGGGTFLGPFWKFQGKTFASRTIFTHPNGPKRVFRHPDTTWFFFWWLVQGQFYRPQTGEVVFQIRPNRLREMCNSRRFGKLGGGAGLPFSRLLRNLFCVRTGKINLSRTGSLDVSVSK